MKTKEIKPCEGKQEECYGDGTRKPHICPYKSEIRGDSKTLCNCCASCTGGCALEV